jgi:hypothetical protein
MLLAQKISVGIDRRNYQYYTDKGYIVPTHIDKKKHIQVPRGTHISVDINDLQKTSTMIVHAICDYCGKDIYAHYSTYLKNKTINPKDTCSKCVGLKTQETLFIKYGTNKIKTISQELGYKIGREIKYTKTDIIDYFSERGLIVQEDLLNDDIIKVTDKIPFICLYHKNKGIQYRSFDELRHKKSCCKYGGYEECSKKQSTSSIIDAREICKQKGYILLTQEIHNVDNKIEYICSKHKDCGIQTTSLWGLKTYTNNCRFCKQASGSEHWHWCGGISNLHEFLRENISSWKEDSFRYYNYTCDITKTRNNKLIIHHLYSFNKIVEETMKLLNLPIYKEINDYTNDELDKIKKLCLSLHYKHGLGVCICEEEHKLFHSIYGYGDNIPEQYYEFKQKRIEEIASKM